MSRSLIGSVSTLACLVLARVSSFHVLSCLMSRDCVLTVSLSAQLSAYSVLKHRHFLLKVGHYAHVFIYLFILKIVHLLAVYLLTAKRLFLGLLFYGQWRI